MCDLKQFYCQIDTLAKAMRYGRAIHVQKSCDGRTKAGAGVLQSMGFHREAFATGLFSPGILPKGNRLFSPLQSFVNSISCI